MTVAKPITWILTANATGAKLYETDAPKIGTKDLKLIDEFSHEENREKISEMMTDKTGYYQSDFGSGQGAYASRTDPKEIEAERFAQILATKLNKGRIDHLYQKLVVIAPAKFHGLLNDKCPRDVLNLVHHNVQKDYTKITQKELQAHLAELDELK